MSVQALLDAIRTAGEGKVEEIRSQAKARVQEILASAEQEARRLRQSEIETAMVPATAQRARILHQARLEALQIVASSREGLIDKALDLASRSLATARTEKGYPATMIRLAEEALAEIGASAEETSAAQLRADARDRQTLESVKNKALKDLSVKFDLDSWGGLTAASADGRVVAINTLEARLKRSTPFLRRYLGALFTGTTPPAAIRARRSAADK